MADNARFVPPGWERADDLGPITVLRYPGGEIRIQHACRVVDGTQLVVAPALQLEAGGHVVESIDPLTVRPSILCPDCGLHGFILAGAWSPA